MIKPFLTNLLANINTSLILNGQGVSGMENGAHKFQDTSFLALLDGFLSSMLTSLWSLVMKLVILIGRFMLNVIEFLMVFVNQFLGLNKDYQTLSDLTDDKIFSFLFNETVLKVVRYMIVVGIILIIIFSIFAIVKSEYDNAVGNNGNSKSRILVSALKSLFMMVLVPLIAIVAIIFSNALLSSVYRATTGSQNVSISTYVWQASTYNANAYRAYADDGYVRPILFNFTNTNDDGSPVSYTTISSDGTLSDLEKSLMEYNSQSVFTKGYKTWAMFKTKSFITFSELSALENASKTNGNQHSAYYDIYDDGLYFKRAEYYVMADAIDYLLEINNNVSGGFYFKSINEIYENHAKFYNATSVTDLPIEKVDGGYKVKVRYYGETSDTEYFSPENTSDEALGTVYTLCFSQMQEIKDASGNSVYKELYVPIINGGLGTFKSAYSTNGSLVIARGIFDQQHNPTAIRTRDDGTVQFYRDDLNIPELVDFFPTISYELPEGSHETLITTFFRWGFEQISGLDSDDFIPHVYINFNIFEIFTKAEKNIAQRPNGNFTLNYNMNSEKTGFSTYNIYREDGINPLILIAAGLILIGTLINITFGLVARMFNMVLLAITYPAVVSTISLNGGGAFSSWIKKFTDSLLCVYGIVVSFNVVLILLPSVWGIEFFSEQYMIERMGNSIFFGTYSAKLLNLLTRVMFILVGFSLIKTFSKWLSGALTGSGKDGPSILDDGEAMKKSFVNTATTLGKYVSGQALIDGVKNIPKNIGRLTDYIPGKAVYTAGKDAVLSIKRSSAAKKANADIKNAKREINDLVDSGVLTSSSVVEAVTKVATKKGGDAVGGFDKAIKHNKK
ncbi:MAG: hypothetical protein IJT25_00140 [Clostridia bacterium]|nr:hypothetical protein [Clostridia bacterium]